MFSIIIPVHNKLPHLDRSVHSVLSQTFKEFELILVDDASTDGSSEKIEEYSDPRIRIYKRDVPGPGGYAARNLGIKEAKYDWIAFLDADDEWDKTYLEEKFKAIQAYEDVGIVSTRWEKSYDGRRQPIHRFEKVKEEYYRFDLIDYFKNLEFIWTGCVAIRKDILIDAKLFPEGKCKRGGDMDTWIRCLIKSEHNIFINRTLVTYYRDTINQVNNSKSEGQEVFCPLETIEGLRTLTNNKELLKAIDHYCARFAYYRIIKSLKNREVINKKEIAMIQSSKLRGKVYLKSLLYKLLVKLSIK